MCLEKALHPSIIMLPLYTTLKHQCNPPPHLQASWLLSCKPGSPFPLHPSCCGSCELRASSPHHCRAGIKAVKLYAWEAPFTQRILAIRRRELRCVRNSALVGLIDSASFETTPILVALAAFGTYVWQVGIAQRKQSLRCRHL